MTDISEGSRLIGKERHDQGGNRQNCSEGAVLRPAWVGCKIRPTEGCRVCLVLLQMLAQNDRLESKAHQTSFDVRFLAITSERALGEGRASSIDLLAHLIPVLPVAQWQRVMWRENVTDDLRRRSLVGVARNRGHQNRPGLVGSRLGQMWVSRFRVHPCRWLGDRI